MTSSNSKAAKRAAPMKLGRYTLAQPLGKGGFGEVFAGTQKSGPKVAIKLLAATHSHDEDAVARFMREAETAQRLEHPNIVRVFDVGSSRNRHYIAMELVHGGSLRSLVECSLDVARAEKTLHVLAEAASALAYAHAQGVVHRDIKPANILMTRAGKAKVADFGLARAVDHSSLTTEGKVLGTAAYLSPEQAHGKRATSASDVYSMGCVLYEVASGELPFTSDNHLGYLYQHAEVAPARPTVRPPLPPALADLALACLAKDPDARPAMSEVASRLAALRPAQPRRRLRLLILLALLVAALAALALVYYPELQRFL